ncbi:MAG: hypothetical protein Q9M10_02580 [Mariprofundaceae bacterium]|nr:hypothetical protein [Mariprofundaceae bacterium]
MSIKTILATAFAMFMMINVSTAMAGNEEDKKKHEDKTKNTVQTVCKCGVAVKTDVEKKKEEADKKAKEADKHAEEADKHAKDVKADEKASEEEKKKAEEEKKKADKEKDKAHADKDKADKDAKDEDAKNAAKYGKCVCPNGAPSYNIPVGAAGASSTSSASTSAFREVRGQ